ncbi:tRNA preQ1(34) S-adenosylmethionine ribosyltransferase-isomerase QueA [Jiella sp. MQZ9-1]|uniref:S-adenosylmethionine:tRNA ribosyltransferase-isomerase n=1 Tax=Jiella flava TaxID=2816857 RepID=A0A939FZ86_9HYPH|nr:tRNA preQ1(34) S-adenosylmethionine ribosyltransferase-isomerase QueA [Jiella flava]MBO0662935.1 tRNA preQ1(34) S-adenosylmethionine ribosyltransferase-isomerase QueA [Jiella flava]MCD2471305.1 tRNA preQ1(34) S-adenosylmethionine ribosyltransferase-isomerase QueA [Jiella flava]
MRVDLFDFELPEERIALRPAVPREAARLLHVGEAGRLADHRIRDLPALLAPGDMLVFNDTKVIPARLSGTRKRTGVTTGDGVARIEATLHMRVAPGQWRAFLRPAKRVKVGDRIIFAANGDETPQALSLTAMVEDRGEGGEALLHFDLEGPSLDAAIATVGHIPLPPYIASKRAEDEADRRDYQTIFARESGAVAAPTAGLHFTPALLEALRSAGVDVAFLTLHVGAGTFLPVKADDTDAHRMHSEIGHIDATTADRLNAARQNGGRIVAVGTTSLRLLESAAEEDGKIRPFAGATDIFITPGYRFKAVDRLLTNFHLPRSTLFMLVSAFAGLDAMRAAYAHAIDTGYRFYSYGDACLLDRAEP